MGRARECPAAFNRPAAPDPVLEHDLRVGTLAVRTGGRGAVGVVVLDGHASVGGLGDLHQQAAAAGADGDVPVGEPEVGRGAEGGEQSKSGPVDGVDTVSYTHLRAHETVLDLV